MEDNKRVEEKLEVDLKRINYIAFKGGGGKGIAYLGPIEVLETQGLLPIKLPIPQKYRKNPGNGPQQGVIGISGTSAGAITSYLVALGLTSENIRNESGILPPGKNPLYDPNALPFIIIPPDPESGDFIGGLEPNPASQKYLPGENIDGFNFEHFLTKDDPSPGYKRAIVFNETLNKNELVTAVDAVSDAESRRDLKNRKRAKDDTAIRAVYYGLDKDLTMKVVKANKRKIIKGQLKQKVFPSQFTGPRDSLQMKEAIKELRRDMENEQNTLDKILKFVKLFNVFPEDSESAIFSTIGKNENAFMYNLLYDMGLFPGFAVQEYFTDVTFRRLPVVLGWDESTKRENGFDTKKGAEEMTFAQFYEWTGLDLVIGGLNVTNGNQRNFSVDNTPDFPVVAAVMMSMNIPGLFKPVYVDAILNKNLPPDKREEQRVEYKGYYVDAGLANNIPFHAFDADAQKNGLLDIHGVNQAILALAVQEGPDPVIFQEFYLKKKRDPYFQTFQEEDGRKLYKNYVERLMSNPKHPKFPAENFFHLKGLIDVIKKVPPYPGEYPYNGVPKISGFLPLNISLFPMLGWILNTVLENSTVSQYREPGAIKKVLEVYAYHIGITDFKADEDLTEFVIRRARERTKSMLGV